MDAAAPDDDRPLWEREAGRGARRFGVAGAVLLLLAVAAGALVTFSMQDLGADDLGSGSPLAAGPSDGGAAPDSPGLNGTVSGAPTGAPSLPSLPEPGLLP